SVGDASHAFCPINNELILNNMLRELNSSDYVLVIEGRASLPGGESINDSLSDRRSEVVKNWYISNGISNNRIRVLYLGETGPYITNRVCETYGIEVLYEDCYAYAPRSIDNNGNIVIDGLNQSVTLYLLPPEKINLKLLWP
ncbi:MAG TPA: OmpA family protein, partial [Candidatus Cloacimonadota bacterium]|nr:OmpA family protein [Candidatus Cloacimonadota bacterium]